MNEYQRKLMAAPSLNGLLCCVCGRLAQNRHHVVPRSQGGSDGPTVPLCGLGNASGCHAKAHANRIHFRYENGHWELIETPVGMKREKAVRFGTWRRAISEKEIYGYER